MAIHAIILAGGKSKRMGTDKAKLLVAGKTWLAHSYQIVKNSLAENAVIMVSGKREEFIHQVDLLEGEGPIEGIWSCLTKIPINSFVLVLPIDMPMMTQALIDNIVARVKVLDAKEKKLIRYSTTFMPFCFYYDEKSLKFLEKVRSNTNRKFRSIDSFLTFFDQELIEGDSKILRNINNLSEYLEVKSELEME